jgi:hypothetical protein
MVTSKGSTPIHRRQEGEGAFFDRGVDRRCEPTNSLDSFQQRIFLPSFDVSIDLPIMQNKAQSMAGTTGLYRPSKG